MDRYICIHGHFYQPPRENPWLETIELQDSAYPYHDWNERITAECYAPNTRSRILDGEGRIREMVNNYAKISFNFGPTLLAWIQEQAPEVYRAILEADRESRTCYSGHGSALAQAYNHMILPLANRRDKLTQVRWGIRDFEHRFGRLPEGLWLPETAVDLETLDILALAGIRFTILSPQQARRIRPIGARGWREVSGGRIDPSMAYRLRLRSGREISLFFYDGPIARAAAFEDLLQRGEYFAERLAGAFSDARTWPQIVHIATDGESYGHHRPHGDMALAYALRYIEDRNLARLTNYGDYLEKHPPTHEVRIFENSSWSCAHGVERWRSNCGCNSGMRAGWSQAWRGPLREALDWLRDSLAPAYEEKARPLFRDPWAARDAYIGVVLDRSPENLDRFWKEQARRELTAGERVSALKLLELQRHAMLMYTSCGWFFDELSGLETVQVMQYAGRALQLAEQVSGAALEEHFLERLARAPSNIPEHGDGRRIYEKFVKPAMVDLEKVGAHYAVSHLFENNGPPSRTYCYAVEQEDYHRLAEGKARLALGRVKITSAITQEWARITYGVVHLGDHNISGGVRVSSGEEEHAALVREISEIFAQGDFPELLRAVDKAFGSKTYSLRLLFRNEQRKILGQILESVLAEAETLHRRLYEDHAPLMRFVTALGVPLPDRLQKAAEFTLNTDLRRALEAEELDLPAVTRLLEEAAAAGAALDQAGLEFALRRKLEQLSARFQAQPEELAAVQGLQTAVSLGRSMPFEVNLWRVQNDYYLVLDKLYADYCRRAEHGEAGAVEWLECVRALSDKLSIRVGQSVKIASE